MQAKSRWPFITSTSLKMAIVLLPLFALVTRVTAQSGESLNNEDMILAMEFLTILIFVGIVLLNILNHMKLGNSIISVPFIYILMGLTITIASRGFLMFHELGIYDVPDMVIGIYWHFFIYLSMIIFLVAIEKVADKTKDKDLQPFQLVDYSIIAISVLIIIVLFATPQSLGMGIMNVIMGTVIPEWGVLHFLAFTFATVVSIRMIIVLNQTRKTSVGKFMETLSVPFLGFLVISTLNHFTALIAESWGLVTIANLEVVEQVFWIAAFVSIFIGYVFQYRVIAQSSADSESIKSATKSDLSKNEIAPVVMEILTDHVGSLAFKVMLSSSKESGINLAKLDKANIVEFSNAIETNTSDLIGEFPAKYLKVSIQKKVAAL